MIGALPSQHLLIALSVRLGVPQAALAPVNATAKDSMARAGKWSRIRSGYPASISPIVWTSAHGTVWAVSVLRTWIVRVASLLVIRRVIISSAAAATVVIALI